MIDSPSAGSCLIPASLEPVQNSFLHREMGDSDGCRGNADSPKPFPFPANERGGWVVRGAFASEVVTKSFTNSGGAFAPEADRLLVTHAAGAFPSFPLYGSRLRFLLTSEEVRR